MDEFEQTLKDSEEQGSLVCCSPWVCKESDITETEQSSSSLIYVNGKKIISHSTYMMFPRQEM